MQSSCLLKAQPQHQHHMQQTDCLAAYSPHLRRQAIHSNSSIRQLPRPSHISIHSARNGQASHPQKRHVAAAAASAGAAVAAASFPALQSAVAPLLPYLMAAAAACCAGLVLLVSLSWQSTVHPFVLPQLSCACNEAATHTAQHPCTQRVLVIARAPLSDAAHLRLLRTLFLCISSSLTHTHTSLHTPSLTHTCRWLLPPVLTSRSAVCAATCRWCCLLLRMVLCCWPAGPLTPCTS